MKSVIRNREWKSVKIKKIHFYSNYNDRGIECKECKNKKNTPLFLCLISGVRV